jgi:hypothetical protein
MEVAGAAGTTVAKARKGEKEKELRRDAERYVNPFGVKGARAPLSGGRARRLA